MLARESSWVGSVWTRTQLSKYKGILSCVFLLVTFGLLAVLTGFQSSDIVSVQIDVQAAPPHSSAPADSQPTDELTLYNGPQSQEEEYIFKHPWLSGGIGNYEPMPFDWGERTCADINATEYQKDLRHRSRVAALAKVRAPHPPGAF